MDAARQFLFWSIPGSVGIMTLLALQLALRLGLGVDASVSPQYLQRGVLLLLAATVPCGFFLRQVYDCLRQGLRDVVPRDTYSKVLQKVVPNLERAVRPSTRGLSLPLPMYARSRRRLPLVGIPLYSVLRLRPEFRTVAGRELFRYRFMYTREIVKQLVREAVARSPAGAALGSEYNTLDDIYHAVGTCRVAIWSAWAILFLYNARFHSSYLCHHPVSGLTAGIVSLGAVYVASHILHGSREEILRTMETMLILSLPRMLAPKSVKAGPK